MKKLMLFTLVLSALFGACRKDQDIIETTTHYPTGPVEYVRATIEGLVVNESGKPVPGAAVHIGNTQLSTDKNGAFRFLNIIVNKHGAYIKVDAAGYFHGSHTMLVNPGTRNTVRIQLLDNTATRFVDATQGGTADYTHYSVNLPAGGIVTATGADYMGQVGVAAKWLDPTDRNFVEQMPGRLEGVTTDGQRSGMVSMGMLAVELSDAAGAKLQIKKGFEAAIRMEVPAAILNSAPATIPLWYFNEEQGLWVEEGEATLNGNYYEGKVKHFSFWNHDYKDPLVTIDFKVVDQNNNPLPGVRVWTQLVNSGLYGYGYTDNTGHILGLVPKDALLNLTLTGTDSACVDPLLQAQIGPFSQDEAVCYTLTLGNQQLYTISGNLLNCDGSPVTNGYVKFDGQPNPVWVDAQGHFELEIIRCNTPLTSIDFKAYDLDALKESLAQNLAIAPGANNAGTITVCSDLQTYLTYSFGGNTVVYTDPTLYAADSTAGGPIDVVYLYRQGGGNSLNIQFSLPDVSGTGAYQPQYMNVEGGFGGAIMVHTCSAADCNGMTVTVTEYNGPGSYMGGSFSGTLYNTQTQPATPVQVSGTFRAILQ